MSNFCEKRNPNKWRKGQKSRADDNEPNEKKKEKRNSRESFQMKSICSGENGNKDDLVDVQRY